MKVADSVMAGKASDSSIKWQLCYDMSARTWWMVSWRDNTFFFFPERFFPPLFELLLHCCNARVIKFTSAHKLSKVQVQCLCGNPWASQHVREGFSSIVVGPWAAFLEICCRGSMKPPFCCLSTNKKPQKMWILLCAQAGWVWECRPSSRHREEKKKRAAMSPCFG